MPITIYPGTLKKRNANGTYSDLVPGADTNSQLANDIAGAYDAVSGIYSVGDYCIYQSDLYRCITAISTPEAFNSSKWSAVSVGDEINGVKNTLNHLEDGLAIIVDGDTCTTAVPVGGYAYIKNNTHGLTEGLYTNTSQSAFPTSGGTANSSVFTAVSGGGLNDLSVVYSTNIAITNHNTNMFFYRYGRLVFATTYGDWQNIPEGNLGVVGTVPQGYRPLSRVVLLEGTTGSTVPSVRLLFDTNGEITCYNYGSAITARNGCYSGTWITSVDLPTT